MARALRSYGVRTGFCLSGTAHTHLLFALEEESFYIVSGRHETSTVAAADGYSRATGRLGVALIKAEQGMPNAMSGILTAQMACSPVLVIASMTPQSKLEAYGQETPNPLDMCRPHVKWARTVPNADRLDEFLRAAADCALAGRPGVAVLGVPQQFEGMVVEASTQAPQIFSALPSEPSSATIESAAGLLSTAKRPLILAGTGAALSGAGSALRKFCETYRFPVLANALGRGLVPEDMTLGFSWPLAQVAAKHADVVLILGMRLTERIGYGLAPRFASDAKFIQVDVVAEEIGRNRKVDVPIVADARLTIEKLHKELEVQEYSTSGDPTWVNEALASRLKRIEDLEKNESAHIHPYRIGRALMNSMPKDSIYIGDGADIQNWMHAILRIRSERAFMDHYPLGSMGIGTPLALGAAAGTRELAEEEGIKPRPVVLVTGDGAFGFYCSELNGFALAGLNLICIVANDGAWGTEKHGQINAFGKSINCELGQWDYHLVANVFGLNGERVDDPDDVEPAIKRAFAAEGPTILNIVTDPMAGLVRKQDPRVQMIAFEDLVSNLKTHYTPDVA